MVNQFGVLSAGTLLNGRYIIIEEDRFQQCFFRTEYTAFDRILGKRVRIAEYFWHENAVRKPDDSVVPINEESFRQGLNWFCKHIYYADHMPEGLPKLLEHFQANGTQYAVLEWRDSEWSISEWTIECPYDAQKMRSVEAAVNLLSGAMDELSRLHSAGFAFRWLNSDTIHMDIQTNKTYLSCFGNVALYPDANDDPIEDWRSEPRRGWMLYCEPMECFLRNKKLGPYSAVYSLCALLYVLSTGKVVPTAPSRMQESWRIPEGSFSTSVRAVLEKGLAIRPADRYQSVEELRWALQCAIRENDTSVTIPVYR